MGGRHGHSFEGAFGGRGHLGAGGDAGQRAGAGVYHLRVEPLPPAWQAASFAASAARRPRGSGASPAASVIRQPALFLLLAAAACHPSPTAQHLPTRTMVVVIDQIRADYPDRVEMPNLRRLRNRGAFFPDAYVGHLAA